MAKISAKKSLPQRKAPAVKMEVRSPKRKPVVVSPTSSKIKKVTIPTLLAKAKSVPKKTISKKSTATQRMRIPVTLNSQERKGMVSVMIHDNTKLNVKTPAPSKHENVPKSEKKSIVARIPLLPAKLSPFRFPMLSSKYLSTVARVAGVFFVATGALFSLLNLPTIDVAQRAEITSGISPLTDTISDPSYTTIVNNQNTGSFDTTPDARIILETTNSVLSNMVPVMVTVPLASEVKILALKHIDNQILPLGGATKIDATTWRYYWDTRQYPDGEYTLKLAIRNQYGTYEFTDGTKRILENHAEIVLVDPIVIEEIAPIVETTTDTATQAEIISETTVVSPVTPIIIDVSLRILETSPLHDDVELKVFVANATEVRLYAREIKTRTFHYVGQAIYQSGQEWSLKWDTEKVPDGDFTLQAKATVNGVFGYSANKTISVDNIKEIAIATTTQLERETATTTAIQPLKPSITLSLSRANPLAGFTDVLVTTSPVEWVEIYALPKNALSPYFLGLAQKKSPTEWRYTWDTKQTPNGDYYVYSRVKSEYGFTEGNRTSVRIQNEVFAEFTAEQEKSIDIINTVTDELVKTTEDPIILKDTYPAPAVVYVQSVDSFIETMEADDSSKNEVTDLLNNFNADLTKKLDELAVAIRMGDAQEIERIKRDIEDIKNDVLTQMTDSEERNELASSVESYLSELVFELQELTTKNESILKDRLGDALVKDSDKDDVSDYDEINLYHTNPFAADTDGDGYIDSVEIRLGYNPHDSSSEALVAYQSAKETGVVREDILVVESITSLTNDISENGEASAARAIISGKGLPNSFVTLYVYSTPIVVTVKTDSDGSWSYIFDKELEEGDHEVYVGITDNAGRIVAKSNPLPFVKTAEAFTDTSASLQESVVSQPSLIEGNSMLLVGSIAVAALGLVLILLGLHATRKNDDPLELLAA